MKAIPTSTSGVWEGQVSCIKEAKLSSKDVDLRTSKYRTKIYVEGLAKATWRAALGRLE